MKNTLNYTFNPELQVGRTGLGAPSAQMEGRADSAAKPADDLIVAFEPGKKNLSDSERASLEAWAQSWLVRSPETLVVMGCSSTVRSRARSTRVERLRGLRDGLVSVGVPAERIRYTGDDLGAVQSDSKSERCTVVLKALPADTLDMIVAPIKTLLVDTESREEVACTNAS